MVPTNALPADVAARFVPVIRAAALRLARRVPSHIRVDDLMSAGFLGLVDAYRRYDSTRCDRFEPYADLRIKGAMLDELRSNHDSLSRDLRSFASRAARATRSLQTQLGRVATDAEVAVAMEMPLDAYRAQAARVAASGTTSIDAENAPEIADAAHAADDSLADAQTRGRLAHAMSVLPERLRNVMELYYGEELTLREIGARLGVTESRVCQLHSDAVRRLRAQFALSDPDARHLAETARPAVRAAKAPRVRRAAELAMAS